MIGKSTKRWELGARSGSVDTAAVSAVRDMALAGGAAARTGPVGRAGGACGLSEELVALPAL